MNMRILIFSIVLLLNISEHGFSQNNKGMRNKAGGNKGNNHERMFDQKMGEINIILGSPTDKSIIASIIAEQNATVYIEYYLNAGSPISKTPSTKCLAGEPKEISILPLNPNTKYFYRVHYKMEGQNNFLKTDESWFSTQKNHTTSFSFGVQGDSHPERAGKMFSSALYKQTVDSVQACSRIFILCWVMISVWIRP